MQDDSLFVSATVGGSADDQQKIPIQRRLIFFILLGAVVSGFLFLLVSHDAHAAGLAPVMLGLLAYPALPRRIDSEESDSDEQDSCEDFPLTQLLQSIFDSTDGLLSSEAAIFRFRDAESGQQFAGKLQHKSPKVQLLQTDLLRHFSWWRSTWQGVAILKTARGMNFAGLDRNGKKLRKLPANLDPASIWKGPFERLLLLKLNPDQRWSGYIVFGNPQFPKGGLAAVSTARRIIEVAIKCHEMQVQASEQARAEERQSIARDLHDGVMQSLSVSAMRLEEIRRRNIEGMNAEATEALADAQRLLCGEIRRLRMQANQLRSGVLSEPLVPYLAELIQDFERQTGISAVFTYDLNAGIISEKLALDLAYMVREGLSNVRQHSRSKCVEVSLTGQDSIQLTIRDYGCGFDCLGVRSIRDIGGRDCGPRVLRERVIANGGELRVESSPEHGTCLTVNLPTSARHSQHVLSSEDGHQPIQCGLRTVAYRKSPQAIAAEPLRYFRKK